MPLEVWCVYERKGGHLKVKPLRIAMLSIHSSPTGDLGTKDTGGMSVYVRELARELGQRGQHVDIYTRSFNVQKPQVVELYKNVRLIYLHIGKDAQVPKLALYPYLPVFLRELEAFRTRANIHYDIIHSHYWLSACLGNLACKYWGVPHIVMFHTLGALKNIAGPGELEPELRIAVEKKVVKECHRIIVAAVREKGNIVQYYDASPEKIGVIPCGVNLDRFQPGNKPAARRQLGYGRDETLLLYVGRFDPLKGIDRLLRATAVLQQYILRLVIVGGDDQQVTASQKLRAQVKKLGIQDVVDFAGRVTQNSLPLYYSAADVLTIPSYYESFGLVALEALACGTPVVATPVGAMESILHEGITGHIVQNPSPYSLAAGIETFIAKEYQETHSAVAVRSSILAYDWSHVASAIMEEYISLREEQKSRAGFTAPARFLACQN